MRSTIEPVAIAISAVSVPSSSRLLTAESSLGGSVAIVAVADGCGAAIVADATPGKNRTAVVTFDPATGEALSTFAAPAYGPTDNYDLLALAWHGDVLLVGDRRRGPSGYPVHVFDRRGACALAARPDAVFLALPPIAFGSGDADPPATARVEQ